MDEIRFEKKIIEFHEVRGTVLETNKYSETHVSSYGGGGTQPVRVHSNSVTKQTLWLKTTDGEEKSIQLNGFDIPMRVGHDIKLIGVSTNEKNSLVYALLINESTNERWRLNKGLKLNIPLSIIEAPWRIFPYSLIVCILISIVPWIKNDYAFLGALIYAGYRVIRRISRFENLDALVKKQLSTYI